VISRKNTGRICGLCLAAIGVALVAASLPGLWLKIGKASSLGLLLLLGIGFYYAGGWASTARPAELKKKYPISSKELRRITREFYESLSSENRR
jgi:drug/metabolite transporter (DMT)-like permease